MMQKIVTIGVYGFDEKGFFQALQAAHIDTFCDIRARRGVRGPLYTFANSVRLQKRLGELGIRYLHLPELAPSEEMRAWQNQGDKQAKIAKRQRAQLGIAFQEGYRRQLQNLDLDAVLKRIGEEARVPGLFCVEREPAACHRSLVAEWLQQKLNVEVEHISP